ncbi:MAG: toxin-antitoxin system YwqK family antitoxin [Bacteroidota bacterium]
MFRISIIVLLTIISAVVSGQDTVNVIDSKGHRQGYWRKLDTAGHVIYTGRFQDGVPVGEFRYYYPTGKLKTVSVMSDQGKKAATTSYFANGQKMAAGNYLNEKKDSIWQFFSESNATVVSLETYQAGVINGLSKIFYPEGSLSELYNYKNGIKDGLWEQYYLDGKLKLSGAFKAGEKQGLFRVLYNSGRPMIEGQYSNGHQNGTWVYHDEKGVISKKEIYDNGKLEKVEIPGK